MAAETLSNSPLTVGPGSGLAGNAKIWHRKYDIAADVEDGDIFELGKIPANCLVYGGWIAVDDIDTGTESIDIDVGWAAAGGSDTYTDTQTGVTYTNAAATADPDGFVNTGVLTGDGSAEVYAAGKTLRWMVLPDPLYFSAETMVQLEANAAAGTFAAGTFGVYLMYRML
ncbi:MAG TPA: hypothetical protein PLI17_16000 [Denitromonas sp.]|nr:hypothetical protein [Denitromonas sp.]